MFECVCKYVITYFRLSRWPLIIGGVKCIMFCSANRTNIKMIHFRLVINMVSIHVGVVSLTNVGFCQQHTASATPGCHVKKQRTMQPARSYVQLVLRISLRYWHSLGLKTSSSIQVMLCMNILSRIIIRITSRSGSFSFVY